MMKEECETYYTPEIPLLFTTLQLFQYGCYLSSACILIVKLRRCTTSLSPQLNFLYTVWYKTKFGSQNLATKFGNHLCLVNTGFAVGSFFKLPPITVAHTCKLDTIWVVYISLIGNGSIRLQSPLTHYALWNFTSSGAGLFSELAGAHT